MQAFASAPITACTGLRVSRVVSHQGVYALDSSGQEQFFPADNVVYAMGMKSRKDTVAQLTDVVLDTFSIGDCVRPRRVKHAIEEGMWAAIRLA